MHGTEWHSSVVDIHGRHLGTGSSNRPPSCYTNSPPALSDYIGGIRWRAYIQEQTVFTDTGKGSRGGGRGSARKCARAMLGWKDISFGVVHGRRRKVRVRVQVQVQVPLLLPAVGDSLYIQIGSAGMELKAKNICKRLLN